MLDGTRAVARDTILELKVNHTELVSPVQTHRESHDPCGTDKIDQTQCDR